MEDLATIESKDILIGKYLSCNSTPKEVEELMFWLNSSEENCLYFTQYKMLWLQSEKSDQKSGNNKWEQLQMRIESRENSALKFKNIIEETKERSIRIIRYAAIIIGLIGLSALFFYLFNSQSTSQLLTQNVVEVPYGSKLTLTLPDRTRLWINSGSKVIYNNKFGIDNRNIEIIGEAYFDVAKNPKLPFIVHAGDVKIKALGTAFNVKAYPEEKRVETTLVHGTVEVEKDGVKKTILLKPSEKIVIINKEKSSLNGNLSQTEPVNKKKINPVKDLPIEMTIDKRIDTEKETAWKEGKLIFEREPLETLTVQLMRKYDVNFLFTDDRLKTYKFSGTFNDLSLEQIMDAMKFSAPIDYEIIDKKVILKTKAPE